MPKMLIADDNKQITSILEEYAKREGFSTAVAYDGEEALDIFERFNPDIVLLDVMMPAIDGFSVCKILRKHSTVPIIMVTARGEDFERIMGLEIGADDYVVKPFSPAEVMARVKAVLRRLQPEIGSVADASGSAGFATLVIDNLEIRLSDYAVRLNNNNISLTKKETEILYTLAKAKNRVFSREQLLDSLWGYEYYGDTRTVDSHIKRLRAKLDEYPHPSWEIKTIWGVGYKFEVNDT